MNKIDKQQERTEAALVKHPRLAGMEAARFYAALTIILFHISRMAPAFDPPPALAFISNHFGIGVPFFFMISAFGLCVGYFGKISSPGEVRDYVLRRFFRIAPLFYFFVVIYWFYYYLAFGKVIGTEEILFSVLFLFNLSPQYVTGFVFASWSIGIEMVFYAILPILLFLATNLWRSLCLFIICLVLALGWRNAFLDAPPSLQNFGNFFVISYFFYFMAGVCIFHLWQRINYTFRGQMVDIIGKAMIVTGVSIGVYFMVGGATTINQLFGPSGIYVTRTLFLGLILLGIVIAPVGIFVNRATIALGKASFGLYLWHPLVIALVKSQTVPVAQFKHMFGIMAFPLFSLVVLAIVASLATVSYRYLEVPGMKLASRFR